MTDDFSIDDLRHGQRKAFESIYRKYYKDLYRFAFHYILCEEAEDIVQDVFIKFYENRKSLPNDLNTKSYLYSATKNRCLNFHRHLGIVDKNETRIIETLLSYESLYDDEMEQIYEDLEKCMSELSPQQRTILQLKAEGNDYNQIAKKLNITPGTVNTHVIRAYSYFRKKIIYFFCICLSMILIIRVF